MNETKNNIDKLAIAGIVVLALALVGFYFWQKEKGKEEEAPAPSATEALQEVESAVPEVGVPTSPVEDKIPSLNPVERVNPFKYENPLR